MAEIGLLAEAGAVAFTDGAQSVANAQVMRRALTYARDFGALIVHHVEDPDLVGERRDERGRARASRLGLPGVPREAEKIMLERDLRLVRADRRALPRRADLVRRLAREHRARAKARGCR